MSTQDELQQWVEKQEPYEFEGMAMSATLPVDLARRVLDEMGGLGRERDEWKTSTLDAREVADDYRDHAAAMVRQRDSARADLAKARNYRSLPDGYVWQDYYSPDEVIRIREEIEAERDRALADLAKARNVIEQVREQVAGRHRGRVDHYGTETAFLAALESILADAEGSGHGE